MTQHSNVSQDGRVKRTPAVRVWTVCKTLHAGGLLAWGLAVGVPLMMHNLLMVAHHCVSGESCPNAAAVSPEEVLSMQHRALAS